MQHLSLDARLLAVMMLQEGGTTKAAIADRFDIHRNPLQSLWTYYQNTEMALDWPRSRHTCHTSQGWGHYTRVTGLQGLLGPRLDVFPGYMQVHLSVPELCETVCGTITIAPADHVCRPILRVSATASSTAVRLGSTPYQIENSQVLINLTDESRFHLDRSDEHVWDGIVRRPWQCFTPPGMLGELGKAQWNLDKSVQTT